MKALFFLGGGRVRLRKVADPEPGPGEALIRIRASGLGDGEVSAARAATQPAMNSGPEFAGDVEDPGDTHLQQGARVGAHTIVGCGQCAHCRASNHIFCASRRLLQGGHADYVCAPSAHCLPLPDRADYDVGVLLTGECIGPAYRLAQKLGIKANDAVAVFGGNPMGLGNVVVLTWLGARVLVVDLSPYRLRLARTLGAEAAINRSKRDAVKELRRLTDGEGPDVCIECAGNRVTLHQAFEAVRAGGRVGIAGEQLAAEFSPSNHVVRKELTVIGSWYYNLLEYPAIVGAWQHGLPIEKMITHRAPLSRAQSMYNAMAARRTGKIVFLHP
jgi:threonine dehydrogenase-like Zn-dependent dehydrogenase